METRLRKTGMKIETNDFRDKDTKQDDRREYGHI